MLMDRSRAGATPMDNEMKKIQKRGGREGTEALPTEGTGPAETRRVLSTDETRVGADGSTMRQPDERDQSADQQATVPRRSMKQAHDDVQSGQQDTDCRNRVAEILPETPKTSRNFDSANKTDTAPRVAEKK